MNLNYNLPLMKGLFIHGLYYCLNDHKVVVN